MRFDVLCLRVNLVNASNPVKYFYYLCAVSQTVEQQVGYSAFFWVLISVQKLPDGDVLVIMAHACLVILGA